MDSVDIPTPTINCTPTNDLPAGFRSIASLAPNILKLAQIRRTSNGEIIGLPTGLCSLDNMIDGLEPGDLVVTGSRPSMGKTALVNSLLRYALCARQPAF
jgi:replicative DNA helicase